MGFRSRPDLAFANYQVPSTLSNPSAHFSKLCDTGHISAASLPAPAGGPRRGVCEAWPSRPAPEAAGGAPQLGETAGSGGLRAGRLAWRSRTCILLSCHLGESLRVPHLEGSPLDVEVWAGGGLSTQGCLAGTAGQVGAVLSAPTAEPPPQR